MVVQVWMGFARGKDQDKDKKREEGNCMLGRWEFGVLVWIVKLPLDAIGSFFNAAYVIHITQIALQSPIA